MCVMFTTVHMMRLCSCIDNNNYMSFCNSLYFIKQYNNNNHIICVYANIKSYLILFYHKDTNSRFIRMQNAILMYLY